MAFEVKCKDLLGRVGKLTTKSGTVETPALLPVVNPRRQPLTPKALKEELGFNAIMTNAYILKRGFELEAKERGVHGLLGFEGVVMTDSGAYQILSKGGVDVTPLEIAAFQEEIGTDIAVILDVPTGWDVSKKYAEWTVAETASRAKETLSALRRGDILWVGPVQGGRYTELVARSASEMGKLPFALHALGSPTRVMEQYLFDILVDMAMACRGSLDPSRPLHLFGAGHPFMFSLAVALGFDLFDSAAYALYAREGRYITDSGTLRLEDLEYLPCSCPVCRREDPQSLREHLEYERERLLAAHNLYACQAEIKRIKQAIAEGRLWELLELRARSHPSLLTALRRLGAYTEALEKHTPTSKRRGLLVFGSTSLNRPEVVRHHARVLSRYRKREGADVLLLLPQTEQRPFHQSPQLKAVERAFRRLGRALRRLQICFYTTPFGVVPLELDDVYPLSQCEVAHPFPAELTEATARRIEEFVARKSFKHVLLHPDPELLPRPLMEKLKRRVKVKPTTRIGDPWAEEALNDLARSVSEVVKSG